MIVEKYSLEAVLPRMLQLYEDAKKINTGEFAHEIPTGSALPTLTV